MNVFVDSHKPAIVHVFDRGQVYHYPASAVPEICTHGENIRLRNAEGRVYGFGCYHCGKELVVLCPELKK